MIELKVVGSESWLDARCARRMSAALGHRLWERCRGHRGLFVTLTYDRSAYDGPLDLYRSCSEEQHVPLFLRKVARALNVALKGRWFCKMEFQKGGWVHWHLIILDVSKIPHKLATELWGHGHVWLRRLNRKNCRYCTKYMCKAGELPAWLYLERPRAIKIVRVSHGFWGDAIAAETDANEDDELGEAFPAVRLDGAYVPVGVRIEARGSTWVARDDDGRYRRGQCDLASLLVALLQRGCGIVGRRLGWLQIDGDLGLLARAERAAERATARPPPLHSSTTGNPDVCVVGRLLREWFGEREGACG